ncbi:MAG: aminoacyl-tRNA hydrolase [Deltaproteobacteria bacterium RIFOXYD12_FULL_55_16]|nr:MAG: aminoacyl-tRNA hydrolase [Deltaproteobacteria bacterium RIFOXYD12_FULL_55_16]
MYIVVGLGNPGKEYAATRHNIGFIFLDYLVEKLGLAFKGTKWQAETVKDLSWGYPVLFVKPQTYMNRSGAAIRAIADFYQVDPSRIIVIHDDLDLPLGRARIMTNRGAGGHNGIRSLIEHLGGNDFVRIRVGIGRPDNTAKVSDFVLSRFAQEEAGKMREEFNRLETGLRLIMEEGLSAAMNRINPE